MPLDPVVNEPAVLLLCDYSLRYLGGAQTAFVRQARSLAAQGWSVVVVAPDADVLSGVENITAVAPVVRWTMPGLGLPILGPPEQLRVRVEELIVQHGVRGIVVHSEFTLAAVALAAGAARADDDVVGFGGVRLLAHGRPHSYRRNARNCNKF